MVRLCDPGPEQLLAAVRIGDHEHQVGVRCEIELAHPEPAQRHDRHLVRNLVPRAGRAGRRKSLLQGHSIGRGDDGVGEIRHAAQCFEDRGRRANAPGLDSHQFLPEETAQFRRLADPVRHGCRIAGGPDLLQQLGTADQLFREERAVLEQIEDPVCQLRLLLQPFDSIRTCERALQKVLERPPAALQIGPGDSRRELGRGLVERSQEVARGFLNLLVLEQGRSFHLRCVVAIVENGRRWASWCSCTTSASSSGARPRPGGSCCCAFGAPRRRRCHRHDRRGAPRLARLERRAPRRSCGAARQRPGVPADPQRRARAGRADRRREGADSEGGAWTPAAPEADAQPATCTARRS